MSDNLVQTWLTDAGLHYAVDNFSMAGIDSPRSLVQLELGHFEMLGVTQPEDRKKLFFLILRVKKALTEEHNTADTTTAAASGEQHEDDFSNSEDFSVQTKSQQQQPPPSRIHRTELGMSVETSSMKDPISPVTLSSPLVAEDGAFEEVGAAAAASPPPSHHGHNNTRTYVEQMLKQRATLRHQSAPKVTTPTYPSSRKSLLNRYHNHESRDEFEESGSDTRSHLESCVDTCSYDDTVSSKQRRNRRKSGIPMVKSRPHPTATLLSSSSSKTKTTMRSKKGLFDELDECLTSPARDELEECLKSPVPRGDVATTTTTTAKIKAGVPSVNTQARRTSIHSRPTVKKANQSRPRRYSSIPAPPSFDEGDDNDDDKSIKTETSDLSTSLHSYSSLSSSISSKSRVRSKLSSRASIGTCSSRSSASLTLSRVDENSNQNNIMKGGGARTTDKISAAVSRTGKRRLSTIPSTRIAPTSPLSSLTSAQLDQSMASKYGIPQLKKKTVGGKVLSRPATADSSISAAESITFSASKRKPKKVTTPRTQRGAPPSMSPGMSTLTTRPLSPMRTISKACTTPPRALSPLNRSRAGVGVKVKSPTNSGAVFIHGVPEDTSWATQISQNREAFNEEHNYFMANRKSQSTDVDYEMRIRVVVRKRPMSKREASENCDIDVIHPLDYDDHGRVLVYQPKTKLDLTKEVEVAKFAFDNVYDETSNNMEIYNSSVKDLIPGVFHGKWASVFAYGRSLKCHHYFDVICL